MAELEPLAEELTSTLTTALKAVRHVRVAQGQRTTWWTDECRSARTAVEQAPGTGDSEAARLNRPLLNRRVIRAKMAF